jgi:hypothetical protein
MGFIVGGLVAAALWLVGLVCIFSPARVQQAAKGAQRGAPWAGAAGRVFDSKAYVVMLRIIGVTSSAIALALTTAMVLFALGTSNHSVRANAVRRLGSPRMFGPRRPGGVPASSSCVIRWRRRCWSTAPTSA